MGSADRARRCSRTPTGVIANALADLLPAVYGWLPTLRIADFEVVDWLGQRGQKARMAALVADRIQRAGR